MTADQDVNNSLNGNGGPGTTALPWALAALLYDSNMFGLNRDYAYPEGPNVTASKYDQITTLAKLLTRTRKMADGNSYDLHDAVFTILKYVLLQTPNINDDAIHSVNYKTT
jgi:hypothetical protein